MSAPVWNKRLGTDSAAIFVNSGKNGDFATLKLTHEYKDGKDGEFKPSDSFTLDEALRHRELLNQGITALIEQEQKRTRGAAQAA